MGSRAGVKRRRGEISGGICKNGYRYVRKRNVNGKRGSKKMERNIQQT